MESGNSKEYLPTKFKRRKLKLSGDSEIDSEPLESRDDAILTDNNIAADDAGEGSSATTVTLRDNVNNADSLNEKITQLPQSSFNTRAIPKEAMTYELESFEKHALIIFNHKEIDGFEPRFGTEKDVDALTTTFEYFGFEVTTYHNLKKQTLFTKLENFSKRDFTDYGCVAVAILTHGSDNGMLRAADQFYSENEVFNKFKVNNAKKATLLSKPKIFIIQACRGREVSSRCQVLRSGRIRKDDAYNSMPYYSLPLESDLLILHSSYPGCVSHRHVKNGSWFIQTLCKRINTLFLTEDLESIMTMAKRDVAIDMEDPEYNTSTRAMQVNKQMPVTTSTLIRKLYLKSASGELAARQEVKIKVPLVLKQKLITFFFAASGVASGAGSGVARGPARGAASGAPRARQAARQAVRQEARQAARQAARLVLPD